MNISPNATVSVWHPKKVGSMTSFDSVADIENLECYIYPISDTPEAFFEQRGALEFYKAEDFGDLYDIRVGDQIIDEDGNVYQVRGVKEYKSRDVDSDMEVILTKKA
jgi:hypothetical protein